MFLSTAHIIMVSNLLCTLPPAEKIIITQMCFYERGDKGQLEGYIFLQNVWENKLRPYASWGSVVLHFLEDCVDSKATTAKRETA